MEIERCRPEGDEWHLKLRHRGQIVFAAVARTEIDALIEGENASEATVVDALRAQGEALGKAVDAAALGQDPQAPFASLRIVREWE